MNIRGDNVFQICSCQDIVLTLRQSETWFLSFHHQNCYELQIPREWKTWTFLSRDLHLSKSGKWNSGYCLLQMCKRLQFYYLAFEVWTKGGNVFHKLSILEWMNLNENWWWSVYINYNNLLAMTWYLTQFDKKFLHSCIKQQSDFYISSFASHRSLRRKTWLFQSLEIWHAKKFWSGNLQN